jgi:hypothetical protein
MQVANWKRMPGACSSVWYGANIIITWTHTHDAPPFSPRLLQSRDFKIDKTSLVFLTKSVWFSFENRSGFDGNRT